MTVNWEVGDKVLVKKGTEDAAHAVVTSLDGNRAVLSITGTIDANEQYTFKYPDTWEYIDAGQWPSYRGKKDDLKYFVKFEGTATTDAYGVFPTSPVAMEHKSFIWKLTFTKGGENITKDIVWLQVFPQTASYSLGQYFYIHEGVTSGGEDALYYTGEGLPKETPTKMAFVAYTESGANEKCYKAERNVKNGNPFAFGKFFASEIELETTEYTSNPYSN
ncbi:MAG: hypothetical protein IJ159_01905 [Prevotella sp.]|nr:hypothetical protein [Prevotella sp.]